MISEQIQNLLDYVKQTPNCEWRNKVLSHLKDALACSKALENESGILTRNQTKDALERTQIGKNDIDLGRCLCVPGMIDRQCRIHNGKRI